MTNGIICPNVQPCSTHPRLPFATAVRSSNLYGSSRWKRERAAHLRAHPRCACGAKAAVVDHDPPHRGDEQAFWDRSRFVSMCWTDHQRKTGRETRERVGAAMGGRVRS